MIGAGLSSFPFLVRCMMPLDPHLLQLYLVAATVLVLAPGPDSLLVLSRGLMEGRRAGWIATAGITLGNVVQALLAAAGVSAALVDRFRPEWLLVAALAVALLAWLLQRLLWALLGG